MTATSPHIASADFPGPKSPRMYGITSGTTPFAAFCSTIMSFIHDDSMPLTSNRKETVSANMLISPVQPSRSSRWGQSVGMPTKLPRMLHTMFSCSRLSRGSEQRKCPVRRMSEWITTPTTSSTVRGDAAGHPSTSTYRNL